MHFLVYRRERCFESFRNFTNCQRMQLKTHQSNMIDQQQRKARRFFSLYFFGGTVQHVLVSFWIDAFTQLLQLPNQV